MQLLLGFSENVNFLGDLPIINVVVAEIVLLINITFLPLLHLHVGKGSSSQSLAQIVLKFEASEFSSSKSILSCLAL